MPRHPNFDAPQQFTLHKPFVLADVFPDLPGHEVIAIHSHVRWSPTAVRVYDLQGRVRFEAWHDGFIDSAHWLSGPGLLVCVGVNSEVLWRGRAR